MIVDAGYDDGYIAEPIKIYSIDKDIYNVIIENCFLRNSYYQGIDVSGSVNKGTYVHNVIIRSNIIEHVRLHGIYAGINKEKIVIDNNIILDILSDNPTSPTEGSFIGIENSEYGDIIITNNIMQESKFNGIEVGGAQKATRNVIITNNIVKNVAYYAVMLSSERTAKSVIIKNNYFEGRVALNVASDGDYYMIESNKIVSDGVGLAINGVDSFVDNVIVRGNVINSADVGMYLRYLVNALINGNNVKSGTGKDSIQLSYVNNSKIINNIVNNIINELSTCSDNEILYNNVGGISSSGSNTIIKYNKGYVTENSGKAVFSGDGSTTQFSIAHGLVSTPNKVIVTPCSADASGSFYVTVDDTYIYVNYNTAPPSGTDNVCLYWEAEV